MSEPRSRRHRSGSASDADSDRERSSHRRRRRDPSADGPRRSMRDGSNSRRRARSFSDDERADRRPRRDQDEPRSDRRRRQDRRDRSVSNVDDRDGPSNRERKYRKRSESRDRPASHHQRRSRSPPPRRRRSRTKSRSPPRNIRAPLPSQNESFSGQLPPGEKPVEKQKPNFKPTGLLAKEANTVAGTSTVLKYHEPPEARKPSAKDQWRLYVFKKKDLLDTLYIHQRSVWLMGRDQKVTDLFLEHPSISKQHAVIQFRHITATNEYGDRSSKVKPYLLDLESANGTKLNGKKVEPSRYVELVDQDVISFGDSEREYVMMLPSAEK